MPEIIPFRGVIYNKAKIRDISKVLTPPYDIISSLEQSQYYKKHTNNIIRLILGKIYQSDNSKENKYTRAAKCTKEWLNKEILIKQNTPAIYFLEEKFIYKGEKKTQLGFIGLVKLQNFSSGSISPHEETISKPRKDCLKLLKTCKANLSPIFSMHLDDNIEKKLKIILDKNKIKPLFNVQFAGVQNKLWAITDTKTIKFIQKKLTTTKIIIADGHHRYEAALAFKNERKNKQKKNGLYDYVMMYLASINNNGLVIVPTHRLIKCPKFNSEKFINTIKDNFIIYPVNTLKSCFEKMEKIRTKFKTFGVYAGNNKYYVLILKNLKLPTQIKTFHSKEWNKLDVSLLHNYLIPSLENEVTDVCYTRDEKGAVNMVNSKKYNIAFFLNSTKLSEVKKIAGLGERMPPKSTYFYPKLASGLVINKMQ